MTEQELHFATHHQAAHAVVAVALGCRVDRTTLTESAGEEDWGILSASLEDAAAVCAAGFAYELILGRSADEAWDRCKNDRSLFAAIYADRTGTPLDEFELALKFRQGVESSEAFLRHSKVQNAIESVAATMIGRYRVGQLELLEEDMMRIVGPFLGEGRKREPEMVA